MKSLFVWVKVRHNSNFYQKKEKKKEQLWFFEYEDILMMVGALSAVPLWKSHPNFWWQKLVQKSAEF